MFVITSLNAFAQDRNRCVKEKIRTTSSRDNLLFM